MSDEVRMRLDSHEKRIKKIEDFLFSKAEQDIKNAAKQYKGLSGGINYLIDHSFFKTPRTANDVNLELKREGYHHSISSISKMLSVDFTRNKKILNRIKENDLWSYVLRK